MTLEQLELRVSALERQIADLQAAIKPMAPFRSVQETFGIFADDPGFDEIIRLGREYRDQINLDVE